MFFDYSALYYDISMYSGPCGLPTRTGDRRGHARMVVGFKTICTSSVYHH